MKYELINFTCSEDKNTENDSYYVDININIHPIDGVADDFMKQIKVISANSQTGTEVDTQRTIAVNNYINQINN